MKLKIVVHEENDKPRSGWAEQLRAMAKTGDDKLIDAEIATTWDKEEWEW